MITPPKIQLKGKKLFGSLRHFIFPHKLQSDCPEQRRQTQNAIIKEATKKEVVLAWHAFTQDSVGLALSKVAPPCLSDASLMFSLDSESTWDALMLSQMKEMAIHKYISVVSSQTVANPACQSHLSMESVFLGIPRS